MLLAESSQAIWLCTDPVDIRKSFDGLVGLVANHLQEDPTSRQFFVFINRRKTHLKILYFDGSGYCIWFKRLEQGQFNFQVMGVAKRLLDWLDLRLLLDGIEVKKLRQYKRYSHPSQP
jgi:transposase